MKPARTLEEGLARIKKPLIRHTDSKLFIYGLTAGCLALALAWACNAVLTAPLHIQYTATPATVGPTEPARAVLPPLEGRIIAVHDGDTVTVAINVRLAEIDAPELKQPYGAEARTTLASLIPPPTINTKGKPVLGAAVTLRIDTVDRYGRAVGYLRNVHNLIDTDVNLQMVQAGAAWQYKTYSTDKDYATAEEDARKNKRGLWTDPAPTPPWTFRHTPTPNPFKEVPDAGNPAKATDPDSAGQSLPLVPYYEPGWHQHWTS